MNTLSVTSKRIMTALLLIVACVMIATMAGCGKSAEDTIRDGVSSEFESIKKLDRAALDQITGGAQDVSYFEDLGISSDEFFRAWLEGFDYSVNKVTVNGSTAKATVTVKTHSLMSALDSVTSSIDSLIATNPSVLTMTEDQIYKQLGTMLLKAIKEAPMVSYTVDLPYELKNNVWQPAAGFEDAIAQAFTGGSL